MADVDSRDEDCGWNVLAADADENSLLHLEKVLQQCNHNVTKCKNAEECLTMLRENNNDKFHVMIIDVCIPTTDGYELCRLIREKTSTPIILMSSTYSNAEAVKKALYCGACEFLLKPIKVEDLRKIDLDVLGTKGALIRPEWSRGQKKQGVSGDMADNLKVMNEDDAAIANIFSMEKRKGDSIAELDPPPAKKRFIWTQELHDKFVAAVNESGLERAVPKKILERMKVPGLTRENVASHLQKYRQLFKKPQKDSKKKQVRRLHEQECKSNKAIPDDHMLQMMSPDKTLAHPKVAEEPNITSVEHNNSKTDWTDVTLLEQERFQEPLVDPAMYDTTYNTLYGWRNELIPSNEHVMHLLDQTSFVEPSNRFAHQDQMIRQLPREYIFGHMPLDEAEVSGYYCTGLPFPPKIEEHANMHMHMQGATLYQLAEAEADQQPPQTIFSSAAYYHPASYVYQGGQDSTAKNSTMTAFLKEWKM